MKTAGGASSWPPIDRSHSGEAVNRPRTYDYPFTLIELRMNGNGEGEGKLALATKIRVTRDGKTIELENYGTQPIALNEVRRQSR